MLTVGLLLAGFAVYSWIQPARPLRQIGSGSAQTKTVEPPATAPSNQNLPISSGEKVFVESFDNKTGYLTRRFRGATWDPQPDGTVKVRLPEAEFFSNSGQVLRVRGDRGEVVVPTSGGGADTMSRAASNAREIL